MFWADVFPAIRSLIDMITAYVMDSDSTEWRLETVDAEQLDTGKRDDFTFNIDDIDFFAEDTPCKSE